MREHIDTWICRVTGLCTSGVATTLLAINLQTVLGWFYFMATAFLGGCMGWAAKKSCDFLYKKYFKNESRNNQIDLSRERDGD